MSAVVEWTLDRPPNLDKDFPDDRENGERARDVWYERRRRPDDKTLPVVDLLASEEVQKQQRHERSMLWKKALRRYNNAQRDKNEEAERKRSARLLTNLSAGLGDAEAQSRLDAEAERGRRRRADAKEPAQQLQNTKWLQHPPPPARAPPGRLLPASALFDATLHVRENDPSPGPGP